MKLEDIRIKLTSGACPPQFSVEKIYHIIKKSGKLFVSDGNIEVEMTEEAIKNYFTPNEILWEDVEFTEVKQTRK